ncbi:hypothetical protein [Micromonospora sp. DT229]|uniref:hypothetical protein n=1 Tax=Micromonospora sp. DT229 TaxID=3393430 RepID=UPI003CF82FD0
MTTTSRLPDPGQPPAPIQPDPEAPKPRRLVAAVVADAHTHPAGRAALAAIWPGLLIATAGLWQLQRELHRNPLT